MKGKISCGFLMVATLCAVPLETAWAHLPVSGTADVYGIAAVLVSLRQR